MRMRQRSFLHVQIRCYQIAFVHLHPFLKCYCLKLFELYTSFILICEMSFFEVVGFCHRYFSIHIWGVFNQWERCYLGNTSRHLPFLFMHFVLVCTDCSALWARLLTELSAAVHRSCQPFGVSVRWWVMFGCVSLCLTIPTWSITYPEPTCLWLLANEDQINCVFTVHMFPIEELPSTRAGIVLCLFSSLDSYVTGLDNSKLDFQMKYQWYTRLSWTTTITFVLFFHEIYPFLLQLFKYV